MRLPDSAVDLGFRCLGSAHRALLRWSGGRIGGSALGMQMIELHTVGRVSGRPRDTVLAAPLASDDRIVLVASKGGDDRDPDWFRNLVAQPDIEVTFQGRRRPMRARVASPEEREELWPQVVAVYRSYAAYQRRTKRIIPVVVCQPR